jgi:uracil-DNA glycosylase
MALGGGFLPPLPSGWPKLAGEAAQPYLKELDAFLAGDAETHVVYPPSVDVFQALELTPLQAVRVVILGQDPYHAPGQGHGLAFSVRPGVPPPPSLRNMYRELRHDLGIETPRHGHLERWARQGVLLLNTVLTVRQGEPGSHAGRGWERFTDKVIERINDERDRVVFVLWGAHARRKEPLIHVGRHAVVAASHPSPLSARRGFFGSRPFSRVNSLLQEAGRPLVDWRLPATPGASWIFPGGGR